MVQFGGHVEAVREGDNKGTDLYLIPYNDIKGLIFVDNAKATHIPQPDDLPDEANTSTISAFFNAWNEALYRAEDDFRQGRNDIWTYIFETISHNCLSSYNDGDEMTDDDAALLKLIRGAHPGNALRLFVEYNHPTKSQSLLLRMTQTLRASKINTEGLRKLIKKYDKYHYRNKSAKIDKSNGDSEQQQQELLSLSLLPTLYTSSLYAGQHMLQDGISLLRELLLELDNNMDSECKSEGSVGVENDEDWFGTFGGLLVRHDSEVRHQRADEIRFEELDWLKRLVSTLQAKSEVGPNMTTGKPLLSRMVAHRGFHSINDRNDKRPIENSLSAFEIAWTSGVHLCECDLALTKDEKLILAHDESFKRLALDRGSSYISQTNVTELTFNEIMHLPLRSGVRPPLLIDVLRSAYAISQNTTNNSSNPDNGKSIGYKAQLIIEIKPGNEAAASALARLLIRHPDLRPYVAMIMSFDVVTMHRLRYELSGMLGTATTPSSPTKSKQKDGEAHNDHSNFHALAKHHRVTSFDHFGTLSNVGIHNMSRFNSFVENNNLMRTASTSNLLHPLDHGNSNSGGNIGLSISGTNLDAAGAEVQPGDEYSTPIHGLDVDISRSASNVLAQSQSHSNGSADTTSTEATSLSTTSGTQLSPPLPSPQSIMPKLMLLTVADPPHHPCELQVSITEDSCSNDENQSEGEPSKSTMLSKIDSWLTTQDGKLDGVYLQYEKHMMTEQGAASLRKLSSHGRDGSDGYLVGVWGYSGKDPDNLETFEWLVNEADCTYVNTDLPNHFAKHVYVRQSSNANSTTSSGSARK